jgi:hypothetical protein
VLRLPISPSVRTASALGAVLLCGLCSLASGQNTPPPESVAADQSKLPQTFFYPAPPAGVDASTLSDAALAQYGFPPRPDAQSAPELYSRWQRLVSTPQTRIANPKLQLTTLANGPAKNRQLGPATGSIVSSTSSNWSGYAIVSNSDTFKTNNTTVSAEYFVPIAQQASGTCSSTTDWSFHWVGIDGWGSDDVLQAGTEADATCSGGKTTPFYAAWYEWYPFLEVRIGGFGVSPGDLMGVEVWYTTAKPHGHAYLVNYTTRQSTTIGFNPPSGTSLVGDSAEWIMERPTYNGLLTDLTHYEAAAFNYAYAYQGKKYFYPGGNPSGTTVYNITMYCPPWTPDSGCSESTPISYVKLYGDYTLWFYDENVAH